MTRLSYKAAKAGFRRLIEERLDEEVEPSISLAVVRQLLHRGGGDAYLEPILRDLVAEGLIELWKEGVKGIIYFSPEWRRRKKE